MFTQSRVKVLYFHKLQVQVRHKVLSVNLTTSCVSLTALKDSSERSINNDWKIELPGEFELAGTTVRYVRRGLWEKMSAKGPTKTPLHLMVRPQLFDLDLTFSSKYHQENVCGKTFFLSFVYCDKKQEQN